MVILKTKTPTTDCKQSKIICLAHHTYLLEVWEDGHKVDEYCPVCRREIMREAHE